MNDPGSIATPGALETLRDEVAAYFAGRPAFAGIKVLTRRAGDLANQFENELGKVGVVMEIALEDAVPRLSQGMDVVFDPVTLLAEITEDWLVNNRAPNGTGKGALLLAEAVLAEGKYWAPPSAGGGVLMPRADGIRQPPVNTDKFPTTFITQVRLTTTLVLPRRTP